ncbi:MAG: maleylacetoacetate isomerase [Gammaproteobacteria bacterium]|nr:maleylacetoacetate isomerase [Gammaproteobacteria bacterium]
MRPKLYDYFRSSCSYRVRIALNLKGISYDLIPVSLLKHENDEPAYLEINPQGLVPTWQDDKMILSQSLAILEYLDEAYPETTQILPQNIMMRSKARQLSYIIACDMHPLNNLRVKEYLLDAGFSNEAFLKWYHHWLKEGFNSLEQIVSSAPYCLGNEVTIADICLVPQIYNAKRFNFDLSSYPKLMNIYNHCQTLMPFIQAKPQENP